MKGVTIWKDGVELKPLGPAWTVGVDVAKSPSVTVTLEMDAADLHAIIAHGDAARVRMLLEHAETQRLPNLRLWCMAWLDPTSDGARKLAEQKLRAWIEQGEPEKDARL